MPKKKQPSPVSVAKPELTRWGRINRAISTHLMAIILTGAVTAGLMGEQTGEAVGNERTKLQHLAVYAGCAHIDQAGNFSWHEFPTAMDDATGEPVKVAAKKTKRP